MKLWFIITQHEKLHFLCYQKLWVTIFYQSRLINLTKKVKVKKIKITPSILFLDYCFEVFDPYYQCDYSKKSHRRKHVIDFILK